MLRSLLCLVALLAASSPLFAGTEVVVASDVPAQVLVDGEVVGMAPMTVTGLTPGSHRVDVVAGPQVKTFAVFSSAAMALRKRISPTFRAPAVAGFHAAVAPMSAQMGVEEPKPKKTHSQRRKKRRNILRWVLGAALLVNEFTGTGSSQIGWRTGLLSGAAFNELVR